MSGCTKKEMEVVVVVTTTKVEPPQKEVRYRCAECEDNIFCEACVANYQDGFKKPSDDHDGKYLWVCPGEYPSQK